MRLIVMAPAGLLRLTTIALLSSCFVRGLILPVAQRNAASAIVSMDVGTPMALGKVQENIILIHNNPSMTVIFDNFSYSWIWMYECWLTG